jgi:hypothetical protein
MVRINTGINDWRHNIFVYKGCAVIYNKGCQHNFETHNQNFLQKLAYRNRADGTDLF